MEEIKGKVIKYSDIPKNLIYECAPWIEEHGSGCYVQVHIDINDQEVDRLQDWLLENYPELEHEDYFFIEIKSSDFYN